MKLKELLKAEEYFLRNKSVQKMTENLVELLIGDVEIPFPEAYLNIARQEFA